MNGMKIRLTRIRNLTSSKAKGATYGILLFLLAFAAPQVNKAQDTANTLKSLQTFSPAESFPVGAITDVKVTPEDSRAIVVVTANQSITPEETVLKNPKRLVLDFPNTRNKIPLSRIPIGTASVKQLRVAQFQTSPSPVARMVFDLEEGSGTHEISVDKKQIRLVFHKGSAEPVETASVIPKQAAKQPESGLKSNLLQAPTGKPPSNDLPPRVVESRTASPEVAPVAAQAKQPANVVNVLRPRSAESSVKETPPTPALIAALSPAATPAQRAAVSSGSRFSGQPLTLDLVNVPLVDFFRLMAEEGGINIVLDPAVTGTLSMKVVKLPWDQIFEAALTNNGLDKQVEGTMVRIAKKSTLQEEARQQEALKKANLLAADLETRVKRLNYAKADTLVSAISDQKTVRGTIVVEKQTNSLILTDLPSAIAKQVQLIETLDAPQPQVEIEARIVSASRNFARDIGVQFGFVQGNLQRVTVGGPNTFGTIGGTRPSSTPTSKTYIAGNDTTGRGSAGGTTESGAVSAGEAGNYNVNLPAGRAFGGLGISVGNIFDTFLLDAAITAGETKGMAKLISQPKVIAQNNSKAVVTQGLRFPVPINANNTVTIQFFDAALTLTATPQITYEGNIVLDLKVENNTADFGNNVDGVPSIRTSESSTRVLVTDGGTTVIGGILMEDESNSEDKVPGLGSLPLIGNLFKRTAVTRNTQEILFFVTPRILK